MKTPALLKAENKNKDASASLFSREQDALPKPVDKIAGRPMPGISHSFGSMQVYGNRRRPMNSPIIQPKLIVNQPGDEYEREADAMAERVMRMPNPSQNSHTYHRPAISTIQRKCSRCEEEEIRQIQRKESLSGTTQSTRGIESYLNSVGNSGSPLSPETRDFFEPRFEYDFSKVRIHTDDNAAQSAESIQALAYTRQNDIFFQKNKFAPGTKNGQKLLAHELTHVVQQRSDAAMTNNSFVSQNTEPVIQRWANPSEARSALSVIDHADETQLRGIINALEEAYSNFGVSPRIEVDIVFPGLWSGTVAVDDLTDIRQSAITRLETLTSPAVPAPATSSPGPVASYSPPAPAASVPAPQSDRSDRRTEYETDRDRRRRTPEGGRGRSRGTGGDLDSDWAGRAILGRYLSGGGDWFIFNDANWNRYMMADADLKDMLRFRLTNLARSSSGSPFGIDEHFPAELQNGEGIIGYQYLHGTNATVGGFQLRGAGTNTPDASGGRTVNFINLMFTWNDIIDPNPQYGTDTLKSIFAEIITLGNADAYTIHITWISNPSITFDSTGRIVTSSGYPFN